MISANQPSTGLSHEALVGAQHRWKRVGRASEPWTIAVSWAPRLSKSKRMPNSTETTRATTRRNILNSSHRCLRRQPITSPVAEFSCEQGGGSVSLAVVRPLLGFARSRGAPSQAAGRARGAWSRQPHLPDSAGRLIRTSDARGLPSLPGHLPSRRALENSSLSRPQDSDFAPAAKPQARMLGPQHARSENRWNEARTRTYLAPYAMLNPLIAMRKWCEGWDSNPHGR